MGDGAVYYDQNLALVPTGWVEQRFRFERDGRLEGEVEMKESIALLPGKLV